MPYATEHDIRQQAFWQDFQAVPSAQIAQSLQTAHQEILSETALQVDDTVSPEVIQAEILLTIAHLYRFSAISKAANARSIRTAGIQLDEWNQVSRLRALSQELADEAWHLLHNVLNVKSPPRIVLANSCSGATTSS